MQIVYIASSCIPSLAANSIHVMRMCNALATHGYEVTLLVPNKKAEIAGAGDIFEYYGVQESFLLKRLLWIPVKGRSLIYGIIAGSVAAHYRPNLVFGRQLAGCFWAALRGVPVAFEAHAPVNELGRLSEFLFQRMINRPNFRKLIVITDALRKHYIARYPVLRDKVVVAADGADPIPSDIQAMAFKNSAQRLQVGYVGHLYKGRGVELIQALADCCRWGDFHIIGGTDSDIARFRATASHISNLFFHGYVAPGEVDKYRLGCDVLLAPYQKSVSVHGNTGDTSKWMSPLKIFEYMAAGRAIICSDLPVLKEVLIHGENAMLCNPSDPDEWTAALEKLRDDSRLREALGAKALTHFQHSFSWKARAHKVVDAILAE